MTLLLIGDGAHFIGLLVECALPCQLRIWYRLAPRGFFIKHAASAGELLGVLMTAYVIHRLLYAIPVLFCITLVTFLLARSLPGGPWIAQAIRPCRRAFARIWKRNMGWTIQPMSNPPILWGMSCVAILAPHTHTAAVSVNQILKKSLPISLQLGILSIMLGLIIGVPAGIIAALRQNTWIDYSSSFVAILGVSIPNIVLGPFLIYIFAVQLGWLPAARWGANFKEFYFGWIPPMTVDFWRHRFCLS